jgi:hypothetical protein
VLSSDRATHLFRPAMFGKGAALLLANVWALDLNINLEKRSNSRVSRYRQRWKTIAEIFARSQLKWITISRHSGLAHVPTAGNGGDAGLDFVRQRFAMSNHVVEILFHSWRRSVCPKPPRFRRRYAIIRGRLLFQ